MKSSDLTKSIPPLTAEEQDELAIHEVIIKEGLSVFWDVGRSLFTIREKRLYRQTHETFEAYCREKWNISRQHAYRLIEATDVFENVSPVGVVANERQARALAHYEKDVQRVVWQMAQTTAPAGNVSASHIKAVGEVLTGILVSGGLDDGSGEVKPLGVLVDAAVTEEIYERLKRQKEYIRQDTDKKLRARAAGPSEKSDATATTSEGSKASQTQEAQPSDAPQQSADKLWRIIRDLVSELDYWKDESGIKIRAQSFDSYEIAKALIGEPPEGRELLIDNYLFSGTCEKCGEQETIVRDIHVTSQWANKVGTVRLRVCDSCLPRYEAAAVGHITDKRVRA
jgi:hypothetical protein